MPAQAAAISGAIRRKGRPFGPAKEPPISSSTAATRPRATRNEPRARRRRTLVEHVVDLELQREAAQRTDRKASGQGGREHPRRPLRAEVDEQEHQRTARGQQGRRCQAAPRQRAVAHLAQRVTRAGQRKHQQHQVENIGPQSHIGTTARA